MRSDLPAISIAISIGQQTPFFGHFNFGFQFPKQHNTDNKTTMAFPQRPNANST